MTRLRSLLVLIFASAGLAITAQAAPGNSLRVQIVDERGVPVRDVVVELASSRSPSGPIRFPWRMAMAQKDQQFVPGTLIIAKGSTVAFPNLDRVRHSIYSFSKPARFEIELYGRNQTRTHDFPIAGTVALGCNIHDGMRGYIRVTETPFAGKTDANGYVTLTSVPAGTARLTVWHPRLRNPGNEISNGVTVTSGAQSRKLGVRLR
ncbi:MAG: methylamine utilization protein [Alphaproteobacteria bacterium]|nr:methylamine utilization protein [Alphaproteobacteria bacterium]